MLVKYRSNEVYLEIIKTVYDGGSLLHRIKWKKDSSYSQICEQYVNLVKRSPHPIVIFYGYQDGPTIKDSTHKHRSKGKIGTKVSNFSGDKRLKLKKEN